MYEGRGRAAVDRQIIRTLLFVCLGRFTVRNLRLSHVVCRFLPWHFRAKRLQQHNFKTFYFQGNQQLVFACKNVVAK